MLDSITLDQLRTFIAAVDARSFSAAGRKLGRAQSVVSQTLANLEGQLGVKLFDRSGRYPVLTDQGGVLLERARRVTSDMDMFKAQGRILAGGLESHLSVVACAMYPMMKLTDVAVGFQRKFPEIGLRLDVEATFDTVVQPVLDRQCVIGIVGSLPSLLPMPSELTSERLLATKMVLVVSPGHPLAREQPTVPAVNLAKHLQLVLAGHSQLSSAREFDVGSPRTWRVAYLGAMHAFLRAGLGWGLMPEHVVAPDVAGGLLTEIHADNEPADGYTITIFAVYRTDAPPGPAGRWFIDHLSFPGK